MPSPNNVVSVISVSSTHTRHAHTRRVHRGWRRIGLATLACTLFVGTAAATVYNSLPDIEALDVTDLVNSPDPTEVPTATEPTTEADPNAGKALTILIIGSDAREAGGVVDDGEEGVLADTHIVMHIAADRSRVEMVSIPRDILVDLPECTTTSGKVIPASSGQYNDAFARGWNSGGDLASAVACDINLLQSSTGITPDGFILVNMNGFVDVVNAIGGVDICIPEAINAPKANLVLPAGQQRLYGVQALGYARARTGEGVGDGSDTGRIERQQHLIAAVVDELLSRNILTDAGQLFNVASAGLESLTTSENLASIPGLVGLARSMQSVGSDNVTFLTSPWEPYKPNPNRLVWTDDVQLVWDAILNDTPIAAALGEEPEAPVTDPTTVDPGTVPGTPAADGGATDPAAPATTPPSDNSAQALNAVCG